jgi:hypothetical protein
MTERDEAVESEFLYLPNVRNFSYDPIEQRFVIRNPGYLGLFELSGIPNVEELDSATFEGGRDVVSLEAHIMGLDQYGRVITFPPLRRWIAGMNDQEQREVGEKVKDAMHRSLQTLFPTNTSRERGFTDYMATFNPDGSFRLQTPGRCACLGVHNYDRGRAPSTPHAYSFHNIDHPSQGLILYAGAGTIAWIMVNESQ